MKAIILSLILAALVTSTPPDPHKGFDVVGPLSAYAFQCLAADGYTFVVVRADKNDGTLDPNTIPTLQKAKSAGFQTDIYLSICPRPDVRFQIFGLVGSIPKTLYSTVWFKIIANTAQCDWTAYTNKTANCQYWKPLLGNISASGVGVGLFTTKTVWNNVVGSDCSIVDVVQPVVLVWYANYISANVLDSTQSTADYPVFGGITVPYQKQIVGSFKVPLCSNPSTTANINIDWRP